MPTFATGLFKKIAVKKEAAWNTAPAASGAAFLRRVTSEIDIDKPSSVSNEMTPEIQVRDLRLGARSWSGTISGLLVPSMWQPFIEGYLRKVFVATTAISAASFTIAGAGPTYTITRAAGSYLTDGVKIGDVVRLTAGGFNAANLNLNLGVLNATTTALTVIPLNGAAMVAEGPIATATMSIPGKRCWTPTSGHTDESVAIEHFFSDISQSELFTGGKCDTLSFGLPAEGNSTFSAALKGGGITTAASQYYTTPTAAPNFGVLHAVNGVVRWGNGNVANITGASMSLAASTETKAAIGSSTIVGVFPHMPMITGQFTALFQDRTYLDSFLNEAPFTLSLWAANGTGAAADFIGLTVSNGKPTSAKKNDVQGPIEATIQFQALYNPAGGAGTTYEQTTLVVQDSQAL